MNYSVTHLLASPGDKQSNQQLFARREVIPPQDDILWHIERGVVRTLTWNEHGTTITLGYWGVGDLVGYPFSRVKPYQIECMTSVEVTLVSSHFWHQDIQALVSHIQRTEELLSIVHQKPTSLRLWKFLIWLSEKFGRNLDKGRLIDLYVTHQDIAEVLNTTRVTVTRLIQKFEEEGKLLRHKRSIILCLPNNK